jgi:hypothetical protein
MMNVRLVIGLEQNQLYGVSMKLNVNEKTVCVLYSEDFLRIRKDQVGDIKIYFKRKEKKFKF